MPVTAGSLWVYARRSALEWNGATADAEVRLAVDDALEDVARHRRWSWLHRTSLVVLSAPYTTGTLTVTAGSPVVTLVGGTWPEWARYGRLLIGAEIFEFAGIPDALTGAATLVVPWAGASGSVSYQLVRDQYPLPDTLIQFQALFPGNQWSWGLTPVSPEVVLAAQADSQRQSPYPEMWAIDGRNLLVYPFPSQAAYARIRYYARPAKTFEMEDTDEVDWDDTQMSLLHSAIMHFVAVRTGRSVIGGPQQTQVLYDRALARAVGMDNTQPDLVGPLGVGSQLPRHPLERFWNAH